MTRSAPEPAEQRLTTSHPGRRRRKRSNLSSEKFMEHLKWLRGMEPMCRVVAEVSVQRGQASFATARSPHRRRRRPFSLV